FVRVDHVDVTRKAAEVGPEVLAPARLGRQAVPAAVVEQGAEVSPRLAGNAQLVVDHDPGYQLPLRRPDDAELGLVYKKTLLVADLIDPPAKPPEVQRRVLEGERQVVGVAGEGPPVAAGQALQPGVKSAADEVGDGRRGGRPLRQRDAVPRLRL